jgi:glycolate oxidase iron-sulfur subunit
MAQVIRAIKLQGLTYRSPEVIATANIGCLLYLGEAAKITVLHWAERVEEACCNSSSA